MAECECFELTLLICEWVCGPESNGRPLQHMGSRFTPLHLKTPLNPDGCRPALACAVLAGTLWLSLLYAYINTAKWGKNYFTHLPAWMHPPRAEVTSNSLWGHNWFASATLEIQLRLSAAHKEVVWQSCKTDLNYRIINFSWFSFTVRMKEKLQSPG